MTINGEKIIVKNKLKPPTWLNSTIHPILNPQGKNKLLNYKSFDFIGKRGGASPQHLLQSQ